MSDPEKPDLHPVVWAIAAPIFLAGALIRLAVYLLDWVVGLAVMPIVLACAAFARRKKP